MRTEAYSVGFDTRNYHAPIPEGYSEDEILERREGNIRDNILRYLGEYRLGVKFDEFYYLIKTNDSGETYLESPHADPGPILNIYRKAIAYKKERGLPTHREEAECLGFEKLQNGVAKAPVGTMGLWISPPDEDMGDYSFTFITQVEDDPEEGRRLRVIPYRNELKIEEHKNYFKHFNKDAKNYSENIHFLASPSVFEQTEDIKTPDDVLRFIGENEEFDIQWREKAAKIVEPLIGGFIEFVRQNASGEVLRRQRNRIENSIIENENYISGKENTPRFILENQPRVVFERFGDITPPVVMGSCGSSASGENGSTFNNILLQDKYGPRTFNCPQCGEQNIRPENELISNCQHCGSDKVSCCDVDKSSFALTA